MRNNRVEKDPINKATSGPLGILSKDVDINSIFQGIENNDDLVISFKGNF